MIRHVRPKLACGCCDAIVQSPAPSRPIERGIAGPGLLSHVLEAKFADHLPLFRQSVIYAREGVDLDRALLASWVGAASALLPPADQAGLNNTSLPSDGMPSSIKSALIKTALARRLRGSFKRGALFWIFRFDGAQVLGKVGSIDY